MKGAVCGFLMVVFFPGLILRPQTVADWSPDEEEMKRAMRLEIMNQIEKKAYAEKKRIGALFEYHTNEAYKYIKPYIHDHLETGTSLIPLLLQLYNSPSEDKNIKQFQTLVDFFALGMMVEIRDTLAAEFDEIRDLVIALFHVLHQFKETPPQNRDEAENILFRNGISNDFLKRLSKLNQCQIDFKKYSTLYPLVNEVKKAITGKPADENQKTIFDLSDQYRNEFTFVDHFLTALLRLRDSYFQIASQIKAVWDDVLHPQAAFSSRLGKPIHP